MLAEPRAGDRVWPLQALTVVIFLVAAILCALRRTDVDVAWLLTLGEKMLAGQRVYIDIFEANPPMSILLYLPAILLGRGVGVAPETVVNILCLVGAAASLGLSGRILKPVVGERETLWKLAACGAFVLTVLPTGTFTQREHIGVIAILPFLALVIARGAGARPGLVLAVLAGLGCGVAMAIKPHFAVVAGLPVLVTAWRLRSIRPIFAVEIWAASAVVVGYGLLLWLVFPAFLDFLPVIRDAYLPVRRPLSVMLFSPPLPVGLILGALTFWTVRARPGGGWAAASLFTAALGGAASWMIQGKAWAYHGYPALSLALLALMAAIVLAEKQPARRFEPMALARVGMAAVVVATSMYWLTLKGDHHTVTPAVAAIQAKPKLLSITGDIALGHPMVRELKGQWVGSVCSQWISTGALILEWQGGLSPAKRARLDALMAMDRRLLTADIIRGRPDIVLVDVQGFDWGAWAKSDPALAAALDAYEPVKSVDGIAIWARKDRARG